MNRIRYFCVFIVLCIIFVWTSSGAAVGRSCTIPQIRHGRVQTRQRGHLVKFICNVGFKLLGNRYAVCSDDNGSWDTPIPVCIKTGCPRLGRLDNGMSYFTNRGAAVLFFCDPDFQLVGSKTIHCDGKNWNATMPSCLSTTIEPSVSCDFEKPGMCGWRQDELHDFDWLRLTHATPSNVLKTGPHHDHTFGEGKDGYYMYIESSSKYQNDKARLLSPLYKGDLTKDGCFSFYYHMYGKATGTLKVYVKPEALELQSMLDYEPEMLQRYTFFSKTGNQGDIWHHAVFNLNQLDDNFEIIIEGIRGASYTSDIAIDDVAILQDAECVDKTETSTEFLPTLIDSCQNRCGMYVTVTSSGEDVICQCNEGCWNNNNCCIDYLDLCPFGTSENPDTTVEETTEKSSLAPFLPEGMKRVASDMSEDSEDIMPTIAVFPIPVPTKTTIETPKPTSTTQKTTVSTLKTTSSPTTTPTTVSTTVKTIPTTVSTSTTGKPTTHIKITTSTTPKTAQTNKKYMTPKRNVISTTPKTTVATKTVKINVALKPNVSRTDRKRPTTNNGSPKEETIKNITTRRNTILMTTPVIPKYSRTIENHNDDIWKEIKQYEGHTAYTKQEIKIGANIALQIGLCIVFVAIAVVGITIMARHRNLRNFITRRRNYIASRGSSEVRFITNEEEVDFE